MAKLSGPEIVRQLDLGNIVIDPCDAGKVGPNSYDLHLGRKLLVYNISGGHYGRHGAYRPAVVMWKDIPHGNRILDARKDNPTIELEIPDEGMLFLPGVLYLGHTVEYTETRGFVPCIETTSSAARLGVTAIDNAGFGDDGFCGDWTLEISVRHEIMLYAGMPIAQIYYDTVVGESKTYEGNYQGQRGPKPSRMWKKLQGVKP